MRAVLLRIIFAGIALAISFGCANAIEIKEVVSPGGIKAWLVESKTIPLIAMDFSFEGGSTSDPVGKEGTANFITGMMDEGAGDLDSAAFQARRDELAVRISFDSGLDQFEGSLQTLSKNRVQAFDLLKKVLTAPHFETQAMERVRQQFLLSARNDEQDPETIASRAWMKLAFGDQLYARQSNGTPASIAAITPDDLRAMHKLLFSRKGLKVAVVGDIDAATLGPALDEIFGGLPDTEPPKAVSSVTVAKGPIVKIIDRAIPQSIMIFGTEGILRKDPDFIPAFVMSQVLGGSGYASRLMTEVREKRGLTYGVGFGLSPMDHAGLYVGSLGTRNEKAGEALAVVKETLKKLADEGPTQAELDDVKTFLTGSYALRFDTNVKIAGQLLGILQEDLGIDYINRRNAMVEAITLDQVKAQAKRLLDSEHLIVTVVGKPEDLKSTGTGG
ncbi:MAG TPA: pitrilysin family protein [Aestuariivirga sp.]|nr:pitrilysin family protein [Aestuariivirga sp.]